MSEKPPCVATKSENHNSDDYKSDSDIRFHKRSISHGPDLVTSNKYDESSINSAWSEKSEIQENDIRQRKNQSHNRSASFGGRFSDFSEAASRVVGQAEELMINIINRGWNVVHIHNLPGWLKDNDFLLWGHRPQLNSFKACFSSIFRIHTETVNIWTHLLGFIAFIVLAIYFLTKPMNEMLLNEKIVFAAFFLGAILCLGFSWTFHTVHCHSEKVGKIFNKLDYCGITLLTVGSTIPWLHYSFYCNLLPQIIYTIMISVLGGICMGISLMDYFATPKFRAMRAFVFVALGLSGAIPCAHYVILEGFYHAFSNASLGWLVLMAVLYISGACIYALRVPERFFPGKFDIWFQSHQIFHVFVVLAAIVHLIGMVEIAHFRNQNKHCIASTSVLQ